jgi:hypothetical protein
LAPTFPSHASPVPDPALPVHSESPPPPPS